MRWIETAHVFFLLLAASSFKTRPKLADLEAQFKMETDALAFATDPLNEKLETVSRKPTKANIAVKLVALAWTPHWQDAGGRLTSAWQ